MHWANQRTARGTIIVHELWRRGMRWLKSCLLAFRVLLGSSDYVLLHISVTLKSFVLDSTLALNFSSSYDENILKLKGSDLSQLLWDDNEILSKHKAGSVILDTTRTKPQTLFAQLFLLYFYLQKYRAMLGISQWTKWLPNIVSFCWQ